MFACDSRVLAKCGLLMMLMLTALVGGCNGPAKQATKEYMFWPPAPEVPHVQFLATISSSRDITGDQSAVEDVLYGKERGIDLPFVRPFGVRMYGGCIYVCDATSANVSILDLRKKEVRILGKGGQVRLLKPIDLAVSPEGYKYVADTGHGAVVIFGPNDQYAGKILIPKLRPVSVAIYQNELFVADMYASKVRVFDRFNGKELRSIGEQGSGVGKLGGAMGITVDNQGNVFVSDVIGCRVHKFTREGKFISSLGGLGNQIGKFVRPKHMVVDSAGILYVVDNAFANVQMFNDKGQLLMFFGGAGRHPGAMEMPTGVCVSDTDLDLVAHLVHPAFQMQRLILVTNNVGGNKISLYALGELKPGKSLADVAGGRVQGIVGLDLTTTRPAGMPGPLPENATEPAPQGPATQSAPK